MGLQSQHSRGEEQEGQRLRAILSHRNVASLRAPCLKNNKKTRLSTSATFLIPVVKVCKARVCFGSVFTRGFVPSQRKGLAARAWSSCTTHSQDQRGTDIAPPVSFLLNQGSQGDGTTHIPTWDGTAHIPTFWRSSLNCTSLETPLDTSTSLPHSML